MGELTRADESLALRTTLLCGLVVVLEGYDLSALGYVVPQLVEAWHMPPVAFTTALTAGNVGMFIGAVVCGWLGDRYGRKPVLSWLHRRVGAIAAAFLSAALVGRYGIERILAIMLLFGGVCIMVTGLATLSVLGLSVFILGFGFGTSGSQLGISALPGAIYPTAIRSTGAGWATGVGRLGTVAGALLGGVLLGLGWSSREMLLALCSAPLINAILMRTLGGMRASPRAQISPAVAL